MDRRQLVSLAVVAIAGLLGGFISDQLMARHRPAHAEIRPTMPEPGQETLRTHRLLVLDEEGNTVVRVDQDGIMATRAGAEVKFGILGKDAHPWLAMAGKGGRLETYISPEGAVNLRAGRQVGPGVGWSVSDSSAMLSVSSGDEAQGIRLTQSATGGAIVIEEADGQGSTSLARGADGTTALRLADAKGVDRARIKVPATGDPQMALLDEERIAFWTAP